MRYVVTVLVWSFLLSCSRQGEVGTEVFWKYGDKLLKFEKVKDDQKLVMVTLDLNSSSQVKEKFNDRIIKYQEAQFLQPGYALIRYQSSDDLDQLARLVHGSDGLHCGRVEVIDRSLQLNTSSVNTIYEPIYHESILLSDAESMLNEVIQDNISSSVSTLESLVSRYHNSASGLSTPAKIAEMVEAVNHSQIGATIEYVDHPTTSQQSLILRVTGKEKPEEIVILGAHLDSISWGNTAPGADDNASGVSTLIEVLRIIAKNQVEFSRTVEFHFYAAEEIGLVGSKDIAADYKSAGKKVTSMMQFDMNSWSEEAGDQTIHLVSTNTSVSLTRSLKELLKTYLGGDYVEKTLTAGTSDFKSWNDQGYAAAFPFEDPHNYNSSIHTPNDTSSTANNLSLSARFAKLGIIYLAHHAGIRSAEQEYSTKLEATVIDAADSKDANLAIVSSSDNQYHIAVSTAEAVERIEYCKIADGDASYCSTERGVLEKLGIKNNRQTFATEKGLEISNQDYIRIYGYSSEDQLIVSRSVRLDEK